MRFYERDGIWVPSVTSVLDSVPEEWLIAYRERQSIAAALDAASPTDLTTKAGKERVVKNAQSSVSADALEIGSWLHDLAEARFLGRPEPPPLIEHLQACTTLLINFNEWEREISPYKVIACEQEIHGDLYNSELMHNMPYAGKYDVILEFWDHRYLIDLKTSRKISDAYVAQCAAYGYAHNTECAVQDTPKERITRLMIVRLSKFLPGEIEWEIPDNTEVIMGLELFRAALTVTHIRLGTWGHIIDPSRYPF